MSNCQELMVIKANSVRGQRMSGELVKPPGELLSFSNAAMNAGPSVRSAVHTIKCFTE